MKDEKSSLLMQKYMYPNNSEKGITSISEIDIFGYLTKKDTASIKKIFKNTTVIDEQVHLQINENQIVKLIPSDKHKSVIYCDSINNDLDGNQIQIENVTVKIRKPSIL